MIVHMAKTGVNRDRVVIAAPTEDEKALIRSLSPAERLAAILAAARRKLGVVVV
jgi:hypothetical protein